MARAPVTLSVLTGRWTWDATSALSKCDFLGYEVVSLRKTSRPDDFTFQKLKPDQALGRNQTSCRMEEASERF